MAVPASGWTSVSSIWFEQESVWRWQAVVAVVAEQDRLQEEYNIGAARSEEFATSPPVEMDSNIGRIQHLEALVARLRRERDDLRSNGTAAKRAGEVGPDMSDVVPEALEELPRWITFTSARMAMAAEREDVALVAELSAQLAAGGSKLASAKRRCRCSQQLAIVVAK